MYGLDSISFVTVVVSIIFVVLATLAVIARLFTRKVLKVGLGADDWLSILALAAYFLYTANELFTVFIGGGDQQYEDPSVAAANLAKYLEAEYFIGPAYVIAISLVKFSVICLYRRIFAVRPFRQASLYVGIVCFLWMAVALIGGFLYCIPMQSFWDPLVEGHCYNYDAWFLAMEIINTVLDIVILCLPLRMIAGLHLSVRRKVMLAGIFLLGSFVCITGVVRIALVYQPNSLLISFTKASLWTSVQLGTAIICASLPTYRPLLPRIITIGNSIRSMYASLITSGPRSTTTEHTSASKTLHTDQSRYKRMQESYGDQIHLTEVSAGPPSQKSSPSKGSPLEGITVRHDVGVV